MTFLTYKSLINFLNTYQDELHKDIVVADYGGNEDIGENLVKKALTSGGITNLHTLDYSSGVDLMKPIKGKYDLGICMDTLEHVKNPFIVAKNITNSLKKNSLLFITVPFMWGQHGYDEESKDIIDYFRFTAEGLKLLFPKMECLRADTVEDVNGILSVYNKKEKIEDKRAIFVRIIGVFRKK